MLFLHWKQLRKAKEQVKVDHELQCRRNICFQLQLWGSAKFVIKELRKQRMRAKCIREWYKLSAWTRIAPSLLKWSGQIMLDFNYHSQRLTSLAFRRPIKPDLLLLLLAEGTAKARKEQSSGMLKSSMMESVNSANGSRVPCCLVSFISWRSGWQKVYWTLTVSPYKRFISVEQHFCRAQLD